MRPEDGLTVSCCCRCSRRTRDRKWLFIAVMNEWVIPFFARSKSFSLQQKMRSVCVCRSNGHKEQAEKQLFRLAITENRTSDRRTSPQNSSRGRDTHSCRYCDAFHWISIPVLIPDKNLVSLSAKRASFKGRQNVENVIEIAFFILSLWHIRDFTVQSFPIFVAGLKARD